VSTPLPDDLPPPRRRMEPETPAQHAERMRLIAERRQRGIERQRQKRAARKTNQASAGLGRSEEQSA
jgi:hypothetical protein